MKSIRSNLKCASLALAVAATLAACGGGSPDTPAPTATKLTLSGTASTGTAIGNKPVDAQCASGSGGGVTNADGTYSIPIDGGKWPCVARVKMDDTTVLHTVAQTSGSTAATATANITPVTQLVVASLAGMKPSDYYDAFKLAPAVTAAAVTATAVAAAQKDVVATLKSGGVATPPADYDVIAAPLTPAYTATLTSLATLLDSSKTSLTDLTATVVATSTVTASTAPVTSGTPSLPADLMLRPAASNCAALRSGAYRLVMPKANRTLTDQYGKITVTNVGTLSLVFPDGGTGNWTANGPCRYSDDNGKSDIVVSPAGVIVARYTNDDGATHHLAIAFADQVHTLAEISGNWSAMSINGDNGIFTGAALSLALDGAGALTGSFCSNPQTWDVTTCATIPNGRSLKANPDGGFDSMNGGTLEGRIFVYRAGGGELMLVSIDNDGSFTLATRQRTNGLPTVGTVSTSWGLSMGNQLTSVSTLSESASSVVSVDTVANTYVRKTNNPGTTNHHLETVRINNPHGGYTFRVPGTTLADDNTTVNIRDFTALSLRGMGVTPLVLSSQKTFFLSVSKP